MLSGKWRPFCLDLNVLNLSVHFQCDDSSDMIDTRPAECLTLIQGIEKWCDVSGLMQKKYNSIANALELRLFCIKPSVWYDT